MKDSEEKLKWYNWVFFIFIFSFIGIGGILTIIDFIHLVQYLLP